MIRGKKIEAIGANVPVPAGAKVVDAAGADVYPGFINARTQMGLNEPGPRGFEDVNEMLDVNPQLRTRVAYHAESDAIPVARANGITTVAVMPGGGTFGGEVAVMNLDGWTWEEATLRPNAGITFNFPALGGGGGRGGGGRGGGRGGTRTHLRGTEARARSARRRARTAVRPGRAPMPGRASARPWTGRSKRSYRSSNGSFRSSCRRIARQDIKDAVAFADRVKVNIVISGGMEANRVAQLLKEKNIPVILGNVLTLPASEDAFHAATYQLAGELVARGRQGGLLDRRTAQMSGWFRITPRCPWRGAWPGTRRCKRADDQRRGDSRRGGSRRQPRGRARMRTCSSRRAIRSR